MEEDSDGKGKAQARVSNHGTNPAAKARSLITNLSAERAAMAQAKAANAGTNPLKTLSEVAAKHGLDADSLRSPRNTITADASTSERVLSPLIPLQPAQRRPGVKQREPSKALGLAGSGVLKTRSPGQPRAWRGQRDDLHARDKPPAPLREQRRSAPEQGVARNSELRGSKSVPDLSAHALAAIRSIRAGTLQLDEGLRSKLTEAAKKVLKQRELQRSAASDAQIDGNPPGTDGVSPPSNTSSDVEMRALQKEAARVSAPPASREAEQSGFQVPQSLATATALARGERLPLNRPSQSLPAINEATASEPPSPKARHSAPGQSAYRPFTVTTGVPRYAQATAGAGGLPSAPQTPAIAMDRQPSTGAEHQKGVAAGSNGVPVCSPRGMETDG